MTRKKKAAFLIGAGLAASGTVQLVRAQGGKIGYDDTPMQPNGRWHVHDGKRPAPRVVTPGTFSTPATPGKPPADAVVLLGPGGDLSKWSALDGAPATWPMKNGVLESGKGYIRTRDEFTDFQLHVEWSAPKVVKGDGQGRGNSGVFLMGKFEVQVLDSYDNATYPDGQAAALYGQYPPLVNASRKPGEWQVYDIGFSAPAFQGRQARQAGDGHRLPQRRRWSTTPRPSGAPPPTSSSRPTPPTSPAAPSALQDHGNPVRFRNIWIRPLQSYDQP